jgi:hypothetical protein
MSEDPAYGILVLVCARTGTEINSHTPYTQEDLARVRPAKLLLRCRFCRQTHLFNFSEARLKPLGKRQKSLLISRR